MSRRPRPTFTTGDAHLVCSGFHSQLSGPRPFIGGAVCSCAAKTQVPPSVSRVNYLHLMIATRVLY